MKRARFAAILLALGAATPAFSADLGVSISVGQPGFYGQIDIGNVPRPVLVYPQPVVIAPSQPGAVMVPIYLHVPPGHARHWGRYCTRYNACGRPVYFVQDHWYNTVYLPHYQRGRGERHERAEHEYRREVGVRYRERGRDD